MIHTQTKIYPTIDHPLQVGVISDTQLPVTLGHLRKSDVYVRNLTRALTAFKNRGVDMILFAGDIGDLGTRFAFRTYMSTIDQVFGSDRPIIQTIMGNHDYWSKSF